VILSGDRKGAQARATFPPREQSFFNAALVAKLCYNPRQKGKNMAKTDKSIFDMKPDAAHEAALDAEAEADIRAGRVVPHEVVREWLAKLARGERTPPPRA
jgi:hypothetical protein